MTTITVSGPAAARSSPRIWVKLFSKACRLAWTSAMQAGVGPAGAWFAEEDDFFGAALAVGDTGPATTAASPSGNITSGARRTASTRR
jgi:hypothetical protein